MVIFAEAPRMAITHSGCLLPASVGEVLEKSSCWMLIRWTGWNSCSDLLLEACLKIKHPPTRNLLLLHGLPLLLGAAATGTGSMAPRYFHQSI